MKDAQPEESNMTPDESESKKPESIRPETFEVEPPESQAEDSGDGNPDPPTKPHRSFC